MSKGIYLGLASVLFLAVVGFLALFNTWQISNLEAHLIDTRNSIRGLKQDIGSVNNTLRRGGLSVANGTAAPRTDCPGNLLSPPSPILPEDAQFGGKLIRATIAGSSGYNIITEAGADIQEIYRYVGSEVARRDLVDPNKWAPDLAWCVQVNSDFTEYTIKLREDVYWHHIQAQYLERSPWLEGEHRMTVDDFVFAMEMISDPAVEGAAPLRTYYQDFDHFEKLSDFEMKVVWKAKTYQSKTFTMGLIPMSHWIYAFDPDGHEYPQEVIGQNFNQHWYRHMNGTGPYIFDSFEENNYAKLVKNTNYYDELPALDEVIYLVVGNPDQQLAKLETGDVDFILLQPAQYKKQILEAGSTGEFTNVFNDGGSPIGGKLGYTVFPRMAFRYLGWNADGPFFGDKRVRRAMTYALNRELLLREVFMGLGQITTGAFYPESAEYDSTIKPLPFDLGEAAKLLEEAGWTDTNGNGIRDRSGVEFRFTMLVYGYRPEFKAMAEFYKEDLKKIGVDLTISPVDWPTMQSKMNNKEFDAYTGGWALSWETDPYQIWHSSQADVPEGSNRIGFRNARVDQIIEEARITFDNAKRLELFHEFHAILHEEQPYTFFFADLGVGAWRPSMRNMDFQKIRPHDLSLPWYKAMP